MHSIRAEDVFTFVLCVQIASCMSTTCDDATPIRKHRIASIGSALYGEYGHVKRNPFWKDCISCPKQLNNVQYAFSYYQQVSSSLGILMVALCYDDECTDPILLEVARGGCGYGRDSDLQFKVVEERLALYVSFMDYSVDAKLRSTQLAYLVLPSSIAELERIAGRKKVDLVHGSFQDICSDDSITKSARRPQSIEDGIV